MTRGLFISFEGIDGAGKSTHIDRVAQLFRDAGRAVVLTRGDQVTLDDAFRCVTLGRLLHQFQHPLQSLQGLC